jgi:4-hydroxythreonine-4-phosphate dehydrogenase
MQKPIIAVTMGDPTGIGPEIIARALSVPEIQEQCLPVVIGDRRAMERGIAVAGSGQTVRELAGWQVPEESDAGELLLYPLTHLTEEEMAYARPTDAAGDAMYRYIVEAADRCLRGDAAAMVTGPINKKAMNLAGHQYPGHTELLASLAGVDDYVMMLAGETLRVCLVTIHEPLSRVPSLITKERVLDTLRIAHRDLSVYLGRAPRIAVTALNPHCGEGMLFGDEERTAIEPAIAAARSEGIYARGPFSADTLFHFAAQGAYDLVVCMYHDQGLIPLKLLHFYDGVNVTLGLPFIRTSVDHGTGYDLAGTGRASAGSMIAAIRTAVAMAETKARGVR